MKKKVLIVDDSAYYRKAIKDMILSFPDIEVVGIARNGRDALKKVSNLKPDIILLDLEMPELDGFSFLRILMSQEPLPVIVISSADESENVYSALELGAIDFIPKPTKRISPRIYDIKKELLEKLNTITKASVDNLRISPVPVKIQRGITPPTSKIKPLERKEEVAAEALIPVVIGASTGGPSALQQVLSNIKYNSRIVVFIAQHIPPGFSKALSERLNRYSELWVKEGEEGEEVKGGYAYISPGGKNMTLEKKKGRLCISFKNIHKERYIPSVNLLMESVAKYFGRRTLGILLTGMGDDGVIGLREIINRRGRTIAQSRETSVVYGMPKEAVKRGVVNKVVDIYHISQEINSWVNRILGLQAKRFFEKI